MFLLRIIAFVVFSVAVAEAGEPVLSKYDFSNPSKSKLPDAGRYHLALLRIVPDRNQEPMGLFAFRHTLDEPLKIWGFGFQKDGTMQVRFEKFSKWEGNRWTEVGVGYCGTGAQTYALEPNHDYLLRVPLWPFAKSGERGVVLLSGTPFSLISEEFDGTEVRRGGQKGKTQN